MNSRANLERGTLCPRSRLIPDVYQDSGPESLRDLRDKKYLLLTFHMLAARIHRARSGIPSVLTWPRINHDSRALSRKSDDKSATSRVLRSNYTRRGSLSRTLNLRNALFLHREKSAGRRLDSVIIIRFRRGQSNYFARTRVARCFTSLRLSPFLSLFSQFATLIVSSVRGSMPERSISRPAFLPVRDIPTSGFLRGTPRKSPTGTFPSYRKKKKSLQSYTYRSPDRLFHRFIFIR